MDEKAIQEKRRALSSSKKMSQKNTTKSDEPQFAKIKLRKTGIDVKEGFGQDESSSWFDFKWFDALCTGLCQPASDSILEAPLRQRIAVIKIRCCACGESIVNPQLESYSFRGAKYHKKCVVCKVCSRSLASDSLIKHVREGELFCQVCLIKMESEERRSSIADHVVGATQEEAGRRKEPEHKGDVSGVLDAIGDDLEEAFRQAVPRCEICGDTFKTTDKIHYVIQQDKRIPKYHAECYRLGRPRDGQVHSAQPPRLAIKQAPNQIVLKILNEPNGKAVTVFFEKNMSPLGFFTADQAEEDDDKHHTKAENQAPASVHYSPSISTSESKQHQAVHFLKRREGLIATALSSSSASYAIVSDPAFILASPLDSSEKMNNSNNNNTSTTTNKKTLILEALKHRLLHILRFEFSLTADSSTASPVSATLTISIPPAHATTTRAI